MMVNGQQTEWELCITDNNNEVIGRIAIWDRSKAYDVKNKVQTGAIKMKVLQITETTEEL